MEELKLGPNGGMMYCMEFLEKNFDWLVEQLRPLAEQGHYFLFDCPGQVELCTHHPSLRKILQQLVVLDCRLTAVHLVDAHHCSDAAKYISAVLLSLSTMLALELPHLNVLSKIDLVEQLGPLAYQLDFYTEALSLDFLLPYIACPALTPGDMLPSDGGGSDEENLQQSAGMAEESLPTPPVHPIKKDSACRLELLRRRFLSRFTRLNERMVELVEEFGLVSFTTLNIQDKESVASLLRLADKANGYVFTQLSASTVNEVVPPQLSHSDKTDVQSWVFERNSTAQENYVSSQNQGDK